MEIEHCVKTFTFDDSLQQALQEMSAEGWTLVPGIVPVAVYHLVRIKGQQPDQQPPAATHQPRMRIHIDESKIKILRNGELIDG